ncbi:MAG: Beta-phosphoglucomutase [Microgenomates group bacterium GW2011_GWC1_37_8]|uniref:HAD-superfamily hydrolase, subfamily IA, variant 3 n=1 Tax=Candidatus Woesebacteria bacterium GW2011_GWB1_38_8 TaxID=1618570 RepID=A0A0G0NGB3_9BACT|nr:MAG: Beta-phosphoglucomutase [Microgenomates group bacterium GW2011_GWC1_37_8]KKQ84944.1 MAG: HAD-superfamily hydrolase, subfamily IA, variant 3 [Candidatus Woesebacteria bacterium GW2011_GWB1_38_8]
MKIDAVIFDLDGTVIADEDEYGKAFAKVLSQFGIKVESMYPHVGGIGVEENWIIFLQKYNIKTNKTVEELANETQDEYVKLISRITLKQGFKEFIEMLTQADIKIALATSNTWNIVGKLFDLLNLEEFFDYVTTGEEVGRKKPDPQIFLLTADKIGVLAENCLVIEDSPAGIDAARAAKMKVVAIARNEEHKKSLKKADLIVEDFSEISSEMLVNLE